MAPPSGDMRQRGFGEEDHAEHVGAERPFQLTRRDLRQVVGDVLLGRVVDQHVDLAELLDDSCDRAPAEGLVADVAGERDAAPAFRLDQPLRLRRVLALLQEQDGDVGPLLGEGDRRGPADAGIAAGDDGGLAGELVGGAIGPHFGAGLGPHLGLPARLARLRLRRLRGWLCGHGGSSLPPINAGRPARVPARVRRAGRRAAECWLSRSGRATTTVISTT